MKNQTAIVAAIARLIKTKALWAYTTDGNFLLFFFSDLRDDFLEIVEIFVRAKDRFHCAVQAARILRADVLERRRDELALRVAKRRHRTGVELRRLRERNLEQRVARRREVRDDAVQRRVFDRVSRAVQQNVARQLRRNSLPTDLESKRWKRHTNSNLLIQTSYKTNLNA